MNSGTYRESVFVLTATSVVEIRKGKTLSVERQVTARGWCLEGDEAWKPMESFPGDYIEKPTRRKKGGKKAKKTQGQGSRKRAMEGPDTV